MYDTLYLNVLLCCCVVVDVSQNSCFVLVVVNNFFISHFNAGSRVGYGNTVCRSNGICVGLFSHSF